MGLKPDKQAFYIASGVTVVAFLLAKPLLPAAHEHLVPLISVLINGLVFLGMHVVRNKGFAIIDRTKPEEYLWHPRRKTFLARLKQWLPIPSNLVQHSQKRIAKYGAPYILLGVFGVINYIVPYFMWEHENPQTYELMTYMRVIGAMAYGLLVVKDKWTKSLLPYLPAFWHLTLLYCLPFTSTVMFLLTQGSVEWLINVAITIL